MIQIKVNERVVGLGQPVSGRIYSLEILIPNGMIISMPRGHIKIIHDWIFELSQRVENDNGIIMYNNIIVYKEDVVRVL